MEKFLVKYTPEELVERKHEDCIKIREGLEAKWERGTSYMERQKEKVREQNNIRKRRQRSKERRVEIELGVKNSDGRPVEHKVGKFVFRF